MRRRGDGDPVRGGGAAEAEGRREPCSTRSGACGAPGAKRHVEDHATGQRFREVRRLEVNGRLHCGEHLRVDVDEGAQLRLVHARKRVVGCTQVEFGCLQLSFKTPWIMLICSFVCEGGGSWN